MKKDARGRTYPTTREEWDLWEALVREGWHPRVYRYMAPVTYHTCPVCRHIYPRGAGVEVGYGGMGRTVCSPGCVPEYRAHVRTMRKLTRRLRLIYHHKRVEQWMDEHGWRTQQSTQVRRVRQIHGYGMEALRRWRRDGHTLMCRHPNVSGWLRVYTGRLVVGQCLKDVHVIIPPLPLNHPLTGWMFNCVARATPGHVRAKALLAMNEGRCQCITCRALPRILTQWEYNELIGPYRIVGPRQPKPKWRSIEVPQEVASAAKEEADKWRVHFAAVAAKVRAARAARSAGAISDLPHNRGDDHGEGRSGAQGGGGASPGPARGGPVD